MCGIFGVVSIHPDARPLHNLMTRLFRLSESRGVEASGFAFRSGNRITVYKEPVRSSSLIHSPVFRGIWNGEIWNGKREAVAFMGHSRLATNGFQGNNRNNQPVFNRSAVCVHNGIIVNVDRLWRDHPGFTRRLEVDTEIIPELLHDGLSRGLTPVEAVSQLYRETEGEASLGILFTRYRIMILSTNTGSVYWTGGGDRDFIFASEEYIMRKVSGLKPERLRAGEGLLVDLETGHTAGFSLSRTGKRPVTPVSDHPLGVTDASSYPTSFNIIRTPTTVSSLKKHVHDTKAIQAIRRCTRCILPETMPLISFNDRGVCNFCLTYAPQKPEGLSALKSYVRRFRKRNGEPDCIVALSGGRDSSYGLHFVKTVLGLHPIAYTYDWGMVTDVARRNQSRITAKLGTEHIIVSADITYKLQNIRKNVMAWLSKPDITMVPLFMAGDKQAEYYVEELKRKTGIRLVIYSRGNQLEDERFKFGYFGIFDGTPRGVIHNLSAGGKARMAAHFLKACLTNPAYINSSLRDTAFAYASSYLMPHRDFVYLWHYIPWDERTVVNTLKRTYGWESAADTIATWRIDDGTPPFYNYIYYHVQGFTEHDGLRSNQIREGQIRRKDALDLVFEENKPRYESLAWYFDRIGIDGDRALSIIDGMKTRY